MDQELADASAPGWRCVCTQRVDDVTSLREVTSRRPYWTCDVMTKICLCQSMSIYLKNNPIIFHPDPIWNDGALGFFEDRRPNKSIGMRSVPDLKISRRSLIIADNWDCVLLLVYGVRVLWDSGSCNETQRRASNCLITQLHVDISLIAVALHNIIILVVVNSNCIFQSVFMTLYVHVYTFMYIYRGCWFLCLLSILQSVPSSIYIGVRYHFVLPITIISCWVKLRRVELLMKLHLTASDCHLPYEITQCYMSPDTSEHTPP